MKAILLSNLFNFHQINYFNVDSRFSYEQQFDQTAHLEWNYSGWKLSLNQIDCCILVQTITFHLGNDFIRKRAFVTKASIFVIIMGNIMYRAQNFFNVCF